MCCSRAWSVSTYPGAPSTSTVSPTMRPGIRRTSAILAAINPRYGPPKARWFPRDCPSATAMSAPSSPGRREHPEREGVEDLDRLRARLPRRGEERGGRLEDPEHVGMLDHHGGDVVAHGRRSSPAALGCEDLGLVAGTLAVRAQRLDQSRIDPLGHEDPRPRSAPRHVHGLHERRRTVVEGGVRHLQTGELADHRLELEEDLQDALRQLRLVWRVRRRELRTGGQRPHHRGDEVVVRPGPREADEVVEVTIARREVRRSSTISSSDTPSGRSSPPSIRTAGGIPLEQRVERGDPDRRKHLADLGIGVRSEPHGGQCTRRPSISRNGPRARTSSPARGSPAGRRPCTGSPGSARAADAPCDSSS